MMLALWGTSDGPKGPLCPQPQYGTIAIVADVVHIFGHSVGPFPDPGTLIVFLSTDYGLELVTASINCIQI